jgi:hypothetical protein
MEYESGVPAEVSRVLLRIEWADGHIREIDAQDPYKLDVKIRRPHMPLEIPLAPVAIYGGEAIGGAVSFGAGIRHPLDALREGGVT